MGRILRIELRRSAAIGVAVLSLVVGVALLLSFPEGFAGRWMQLAVSARLMLLVLWPLTLAGGAWLGRREARSRVNELFASTVRPRWQRSLPTAGALAVTVVTAYILTFLVGVAWVAPTSGYFPLTAIAVAAVGALALIGAAWLGMAAGRAVPRLITAPALAVAGVALVGLLPEWVISAGYDEHFNKVRPDPAALLLSPVPSSGLDDFQTVVAQVNLLQTLWLAAVAVTGLLLLGAVGRRAIALAVLPAVLGVAVVVPLMPAGAYEAAAAADPEAVELVCDNDGPQVCVTRVHAALLPDVVGPARQALTMLRAKLPNAPTRAAETQQVPSWSSSSPAPVRTRYRADTLVFERPSIGPTGRADFTDAPFLPYLLEAAWSQDCGDQPDDDGYLGRVLAAAWLTGRPPTAPDWWKPEERARVDVAYQALVGLPPAEQGRRMAAAREAVLDCRADALRPILPADTP